jgi:hypothetical protein
MIERPWYSPFSVREKLPWFAVSFVLFLLFLEWVSA